MRSDVAMDTVKVEQAPPAVRRWPVAAGLAAGACASLSLWALIALGARALLG